MTQVQCCNVQRLSVPLKSNQYKVMMIGRKVFLGNKTYLIFDKFRDSDTVPEILYYAAWIDGTVSNFLVGLGCQW